MKDRPQVSIIIPTHNRPALLRRALASALAQEGAEIEIIVIDDGSDEPAQVDAPSDIVLVRTENQGASAARNEGLDRARGDYVLFLDSDDWLEPGAVMALLQTIDDECAGLAFGFWRNVDATSGISEVVAPAASYVDGLANAVAGGWVAGSVLMARRIAARFDPALKTWEVVAFVCESLAGGAAVAACRDVVVNVSQHCDPARISIRHDHFEPFATARVFIDMKNGLAARGLLNEERVAALDARLLACLHALLRRGRVEARQVYDAIDWQRVARQDSYRPASFAWCARWGGLPGARGFLALNEAIGR